jgi:hypothetical protein
LERGADHAFKAGAAQCALCHAEPSEQVSLVPEAERLWQELVTQKAVRRVDPSGATTEEPLHAQGYEVVLNSRLGRAAYNVALVIADRAAHVHNPKYAKKLLRLARETLDSHKSSQGAAR